MGSIGSMYLLIGFAAAVIVCIIVARADIAKKFEQNQGEEKAKEDSGRISNRTLYVKPHHALLRDEDIRVDTARRYEENKKPKQIDKDREEFLKRQKRAKELWGVEIKEEDPGKIDASSLW